MQEAVKFYKSWDRHGALSNFSPHPIAVPGGASGESQRWASVEHFYQAHKFVGGSDPAAAELIQVLTPCSRFCSCFTTSEAVCCAFCPRDSRRCDCWRARGEAVHYHLSCPVA